MSDLTEALAYMQEHGYEGYGSDQYYRIEEAARLVADGEVIPRTEVQPLIDQIVEWSNAYPLSVFPEPDHTATGHDPSLCSASMGRHVIGRLMETMVEAGLWLPEDSE